MTARRRIEEALRGAQVLLHSLTDGAPVGLSLFRRDGTLLTANRPFARLLGYDSPAELRAVGGVLGFFATPEDQSRALGSISGTDGRIEQACFRTKDGCRRAHAMIAAACVEQEAIVVVVFDRVPVGTASSRAEGG
jgi:PAS domain-containing protein